VIRNRLKDLNRGTYKHVKYIQNRNLICCLYACETWYLKLREEHRLVMFQESSVDNILN
jgi:hypothetical protein